MEKKLVNLVTHCVLIGTGTSNRPWHLWVAWDRHHPPNTTQTCPSPGAKSQDLTAGFVINSPWQEPADCSLLSEAGIFNGEDADRGYFHFIKPHPITWACLKIGMPHKIPFFIQKMRINSDKPLILGVPLCQSPSYSPRPMVLLGPSEDSNTAR